MAPDLAVVGTDLEGFTLFPSLPAELRIKIWQHTFEPRVLELHSGRNHYQLPDTALWCSDCGNPVALSVCEESRAEALLFYAVALPLGDKNGDPTHRVLYFNPAVDTIALLGHTGYNRLRNIFETVELLDPECVGLQRVALSISGWRHDYAGQMLTLWSRGLFRNLERFMLLMYTENRPPANFRGGECNVEECVGMDSFLTMTMGQRSKLKRDDKWIVVGKTEMRIMYLNFTTGAWTR